MKKLILALMALFASPAMAQTPGQWGPDGPQPVIWDTSGIVGNGVAQTCATGEVFTAAQGGCPPATAYEPAAIDQVGYDRTQWTETGPAGTCGNQPSGTPYGHDGEPTGCRPWGGEDKIRVPCGFAFFSDADPLIAPGQDKGPHRHTVLGWYGDPANFKNLTYATMRNAPKSRCAGGPLNATAYWVTSLILEQKPGVIVEVKPEGVETYYNHDPESSPTRVRLLRGQTVIGGKNPMAMDDAARLAELSSQPPAPGQSWQPQLPTSNYKCVRRSDGATILFTDGQSFGRSWLKSDGSNPWGAGNCEGANYQIWSYVNAPTCWDGHNLTSPNGRDHWRYEALYNNKLYCPRGWWRTPSLTAIHFYPAFTHSQRQKMYLSSDRMGSDSSKWSFPGTSIHFDWANGWDDVTFKTAQKECLGLTINGQVRVGGSGTLQQGRTCQTAIISNLTALKVGGTPDISLSDAPGIFTNLSSVASKYKFGPILPGSAKVSAMAGH